MANESYEEFAKALQNEIEEDTGIKFGYLHKHSFARIEVGTDNDKAIYLNEEKSVRLYDYFVEKGYVREEVVNKKTKEFAAKVQEKLKMTIWRTASSISSYSMRLQMWKKPWQMMPVFMYFMPILKALISERHSQRQVFICPERVFGKNKVWF